MSADGFFGGLAGMKLTMVVRSRHRPSEMYRIEGLREISSKGMAGEHREMQNAWRLSSLGCSGPFCFAGRAMYGEQMERRISSA